jgi:hypothetical protein
LNLRPPGYEQGEPVSDSLIHLPRHHSSCSPTPSTSHPSPSVPLRPLASWSRIWSRMFTLPGKGHRPGPAPRFARKRPLGGGRRSDVGVEVSLVDVVRPRPSTMNAASSALADPGSRATGRCGGQGSLGRSDRTRAWPPRMRSPSPDTSQVGTQRSRAAPETPPELDQWTGMTRGPRGHANPPGAPVAVFDPPGQVRASVRLTRSGTLQRRRIDHPDIIGPHAGVAGQSTVQPVQRGRKPASRCRTATTTCGRRRAANVTSSARRTVTVRRWSRSVRRRGRNAF